MLWTSWIQFVSQGVIEKKQSALKLLRLLFIIYDCMCVAKSTTWILHSFGNCLFDGASEAEADAPGGLVRLGWVRL